MQRGILATGKTKLTSYVFDSDIFVKPLFLYSKSYQGLDYINVLACFNLQNSYFTKKKYTLSEKNKNI